MEKSLVEMTILGTIFNYLYQGNFVYQLLATLTTFYTILVVRFYIIRNRRYQLLKKYYGFDGPKPSLFLDGNLYQYYEERRTYKVAAENARLYGPTWAENHGDMPMIQTIDADLIRHVFLENTETFCEKPILPVDIRVAHGILFSPHKNKWKLFRKILGGPLNRFTSLGNSSTQFVQDSASILIDYIDNKISSNNNGIANINLYKLFKCNALYMVSELAIKLPIGIREDEPNVAGLDDYLAKMDGPIARLSLIFPFLFTIASYLIEIVLVNRYMKIIYRALDERFLMTSKMLDEQEKSGLATANKNTTNNDNEAIIDTLIRHVRLNRLEYIEFVGNIEGLLIAGYHTTSTTLIYAMWCLAKHANVQENLKNDLICNGYNSRYLEQCINETMRLYPVVIAFVNRVATKTINFNGIWIPEGTIVLYHNYTMHRNARYWPEPDKFDPDRFAEDKVIDTVAFAPFGFAERRCLGAKLAMLEMRVIITEIVLRYKLILESPEELEMLTCSGFLTEPSKPIKIRLERRQFDAS